jgi:uncharacterized protein YaaR (DUF327 family)
MPKQSNKPKLPKGITEEFVGIVESESTDSLKQLIVQMQSQIEESKEFLTENDQVQDLKAAYDEAVAPARETIRTLRARTKFVVEALKKSGAL